jgi:IclR family pca regulon transcriptional regulator
MPKRGTIVPIIGTPERHRLQTLDRSTEVLEAVVQSGGMTLAEVQRRLGLGNTVSHRILQTWTELDYLALDPDSKLYRAGVKLLALGLRVRGGFVNEDLQQRLRAVADQLNCTTNAALLYGKQVFHIARAESRYVSPLQLEIGTTLPAHVTALGRVLLAQLPPDRIRALYGDGPLPAYGSQSDRTVDELIADLGAVRKSGFALCYQTINESSGAVAVPLHDAAGTVVAAINAVGAIERFDQATIAASILPELRRAAQQPFELPQLFGGQTATFR